jgi:hemoglobin
MRDINSPEDCSFLIEHFYDKLLKDPLIGHFFSTLPLQEHIERVASFWSFILLDKPGYTGNMMEAHSQLKLTSNDFDRWLELFHETINDHFSGEKANLAIQRSSIIAMTMRSKMT